MKTQFADVAKLFVDGNMGIYVAQIMAKLYPFSSFQDLHEEDYGILHFGPEHNEYANTYEALENSSVTDNGITYNLITIDGNLYGYPDSEHENIDWDAVLS